MTYYLSLTVGFTPSEVINEEDQEETTKAFNLVEIEDEEDIVEDGSYLETKVLVSSETKGNLLEFLVKLNEFEFEEISELMERVEVY